MLFIELKNPTDLRVNFSLLNNPAGQRASHAFAYFWRSALKLNKFSEGETSNSTLNSFGDNPLNTDQTTGRL